jgi:hypothetical protein
MLDAALDVLGKAVGLLIAGAMLAAWWWETSGLRGASCMKIVIDIDS